MRFASKAAGGGGAKIVYLTIDEDYIDVIPVQALHRLSVTEPPGDVDTGLKAERTRAPATTDIVVVYNDDPN